MNWDLYVDESGNFEGQSSVVVGLLSPRPHDHGAAWRAALTAATAPWPYPAHAAHLNRAAAWLWAAERSGVPDRLEPVLGPALALWRKAPKPLREALDVGRLPAIDALDAADAWLAARVPAAVQALRAHASEASRRLDDLLDAIGVHGGALLLTAAPTAPPPPLAQPGRLVQDRYVAALSALLVRVTALVPAADAVDLYIATRDVRFHGVPNARDLGLPALKQLVKDATEAVHRVAPATPRLAIVRQGRDFVVRYDSNVHPGVVLADHAAGRVRRAVNRSQRDDRIAARLRDLGALGRYNRLPLHFAASPGNLPTFAHADLEPRVRAALQGKAPIDPPQSAPWANQATLEWELAARVAPWT